MPTIDLIRDCDISRSIRCQQLEAIFDVPPSEKCHLEWKGNLPIENTDWNIGLIVGPSGSGKSTIAQEVFKDSYHVDFEWKGKSVIDDFKSDLSIEDIIHACSSVGFKTIPAWMRPYSVLSTGERFRVEIARRLLELPDPIVVDEFTSVVDRQVAQVGSYAIQKQIRKQGRKFVAVSCHFDIIEWLMPDWIFYPATMEYKPRGSLQQFKRPEIEVEIKRVEYGLWKIFAPFHYLTASLNKASRCFGLFINGQIVHFAGILNMPGTKAAQDIMKISRGVTLPDWQGLGLAFVMNSTLAKAYKAVGKRLRLYPNHPPLIRSIQRMPDWRQAKKSGYQQKQKKGGLFAKFPNRVSRPCAVFEWCGDIMDKETAKRLLNGI